MHQTVALDIVRRPKATPVHELERYMRCRQCSEIRGYAYKRSHLVALRATKISASDPPSTGGRARGENAGIYLQGKGQITVGAITALVIVGWFAVIALAIMVTR